MNEILLRKRCTSNSQSSNNVNIETAINAITPWMIQAMTSLPTTTKMPPSMTPVMTMPPTTMMPKTNLTINQIYLLLLGAMNLAHLE